MRFGRRVTLNQLGGVVTTREEVIAEFSTVKDTTILTETVRVKDYREALAIFLSLMDQAEAGEITHPGIQVLHDPLRIEKTWSPAHN